MNIESLQILAEKLGFKFAESDIRQTELNLMIRLNWRFKFVSCEEISYTMLNTFWQFDRQMCLPREFLPNVQGLVRPGLLYRECLSSTYRELAAAVAIVAIEIVNVNDVRLRLIHWMSDDMPDLNWVGVI